MKRVAIVGLGLIGGSLGLALKEHLPELEVVGVARRQETAVEAEAVGAVDRAGVDLALIAGADLVVLACPLAATASVLEDTVPHLAEGARVTDVGSAKEAIVEHAGRVLDGERNPFLGGHPMAGKEVSGIQHAEASLFEGRPWVLTPRSGWFAHLRDALDSERAGTPGGYEPQGWQDFTSALRSIGALPVFLPPAKHDRYVALISHVPFLLSAAYVLAVGGEEDWGEASELASSGFRDISRLAGGDTDMYAAIASANRGQVVAAWADLRAAMDRFETAITRPEEASIDELLAEARRTRRAWADQHPGLV